MFERCSGLLFTALIVLTLAKLLLGEPVEGLLDHRLLCLGALLIAQNLDYLRAVRRAERAEARGS